MKRTAAAGRNGIQRQVLADQQRIGALECRSCLGFRGTGIFGQSQQLADAPESQLVLDWFSCPRLFSELHATTSALFKALLKQMDSDQHGGEIARSLGCAPVRVCAMEESRHLCDDVNE
jgi:hypothetical protein